MDAEVLRQAAHWHARLLDAPDGPSRQAVEAGFQAWCRMREEHALAYVAVTKAGALAQDLAGEPALVDAVASARARAEGLRTRKRRIGIAAICGAVVMTPVAALTIRHFTRPEAAPSLAATAYKTGIGERKTITLPDATRILLDTSSSVSVRRNVLRVRGQAYVTAGMAPVVVETGDVSLRLRRGEANVRSDATRSQIFVPGQSVIADVRGPGGATAIKAGQILTVDDRRARVVPAADPAAVISWRSGWLLFDDVPLSRAAAELNRYRRVPIGLAPETRGLRISGSFRTNDNADFLHAVAATLPATVSGPAERPMIVSTPPGGK